MGINGKQESIVNRERREQRAQSESHSSQWKLGHVQGVVMEEGKCQCHHLRDT